MSGSIVAVTPANPDFDLEAMIIETISHQDLSEALDDPEGLSPPPSPSLNASLSEDLSTHTSGEPVLLSPPPLGLSTPPSDEKASDKCPASLSLDTPTHTASAIDASVPKEVPRKATNPRPENRQTRKNALANNARGKKRAREAEAGDAYHHARENARQKYQGNATPILCDIDTEKLRASTKGGNKTSYTLEEDVGKNSKLGFRLQKWDSSHSMVLVDNKKRIIGVLAGRPDAKDWPELHDQACKAMEDRCERCTIPKEQHQKGHRRGRFVALACGVSHGGGQKSPGNLQNSPQNEAVLSELNEMKPFTRVVGFASSVMASWYPDLHQHYCNMTDALHTHIPHLVRPFPGSAFSAFTYNLGPCTVCYKHKDNGNYTTGVCAVTPYGVFDYTKGGHLILWELGLVVEFPPGTTILLPSAIISHSNVSISEGETRYSFAQYTAAGLFRWVENDYKTRAEYVSSLTAEQLVADGEKQRARLEFGLSLLPVLNANIS